MINEANKESINQANISKILECHECALEVTIPQLREGQKAQCPRCGFIITAMHFNSIERILAFSITALIFLLASLPFDFLSFQSNGLENKFSIISSFNVLIESHYTVLAILQLFTIFIIPTTLLVLLIILLVPLRKGRYPNKGHGLLKIIFKLMPWCMVEIFLVGALVSLVKIIGIADVQLGPSFYAFIFFSMSMTSALLHVDKVCLTELLRLVDVKTLKKINIHDKTLTNKRLSIQTTWALIITSVVLYIPANLLPIMNTRLFGQDDPSTILGGVILLWGMGSYPIALIIFIASVAVPVTKILALAWLNYSVQSERTNMTTERIKLYRIAEFVGRWSMVDVFVVIILASLIQLGNTISIVPGSATIAFSGVVIVTMLAAMSFEPHLIWKHSKNYDKQNEQ
ncbi:MAG: PqiA protein [Gammaproteobacteria bacterium]|nr:MAG: PqiA protein [Gammaproteobacteria bacterium]